MPVARFSYSQGDNDKQPMHAAQTVMEDILHAAGGAEVITIDRYAYLVGGARMATDEGTAWSTPTAAASPYQSVHHRRQRAAYPGKVPTRP